MPERSSFRTPPSPRKLPARPDLDHVKRQAKHLLSAFAAREPDAVAEVTAHYRDVDPAGFALHHAQLVLARAYGFESWPKLRARVNGVTVERLCEAIERGDAAAVRDMLRRRPEIVNLERPEHGEQRALHAAVVGRRAAMVQVLMEHGADARIGIWPNRDATSALTIATERSYDEIVDIIRREEQRRREAYQAGTSANATATHALDELFEIIACGDEARAIAMLEADPALIRTVHPDGWTPVHTAAAVLNVRMVGWLLQHSAEVNARGKDDWTPLDLAACGRYWGRTGGPERFAVVASLLRERGAGLGAVSAVAIGDADWVRARHAEGALLNATSLNVLGPFGGLLSTAVRHDRTDMVALLLDLGLDPDERVRLEGADELGYSWGQPLHLCARSSKLALAEMLLARARGSQRTGVRQRLADLRRLFPEGRGDDRAAGALRRRTRRRLGWLPPADGPGQANAGG